MEEIEFEKNLELQLINNWLSTLIDYKLDNNRHRKTIINRTRTSFLPNIRYGLPNVQLYLILEKYATSLCHFHEDKTEKEQKLTKQQANL
jgi:hypothetical protein